MGQFSLWHFIAWLLMVFIFIFPFWKIVAKAGYSGAWSLLAFVPIVNFIMLWVFAFANWPRIRSDA